MSSFNELKEILATFTEFTDQELEFENNYCAIADSEGNVIHIYYAPVGNEITVLGALGKLFYETAFDNTVLKLFMSMNFLAYETNGASFALSDGSYIVLQRKYESEFISREDLSNFLYAFDDELKIWIERYQNVVEQIEDGESILEIEIS